MTGPVQRVTVRYFAGAADAAGTDEERLQVPGGSTVRSILDTAVAARGAALARVLAVCSVLVDGTRDPDGTTPVPDGAVVDVLPPFAGG